MFEEYTEEYFMEQARSMGRECGVDTRQGSVYMDAAAGHCIRAAKFMNDLSMSFEMLAVDTCTGNILEERAAHDGIYRHPSTQSYWNVIFEGTIPEVGTRFFCQSYYFKLVMLDEKLLLESEIYGIKTNYLIPGETVIPVYNIQGLISCTLGELYIPGAEAESDDSLRQRWKEKKFGPAENGNKLHYKVWCESVPGVGRAHIIPLFGGENTVRAIIYATNGELPSESILEAVQEYIDPIVEGYQVEVDGMQYVFGDGLGEGVANLGAHFLASAPEEIGLTISFDADLRDGCTLAQAQTEVMNKVKEYICNLVLKGGEEITIRLSNIASLISASESIVDYTPASLMINGLTENVLIGIAQAAIVQEVVINA